MCRLPLPQSHLELNSKRIEKIEALKGPVTFAKAEDRPLKKVNGSAIYCQEKGLKQGLALEIFPNQSEPFFEIDGTNRTYNGTIYFQFVNGKREGPAIHIFENRAFYLFHYVNDKREGKAIRVGAQYVSMTYK